MRKNQIIWAVLAVVFVVILAIPAVMLYRGVSSFGEMEDKLDQSVNTLNKFYASDPFPSAENIAAIDEQGVALEEWYRKLLAAAARNQVASAEKSPSVFKDLYGRQRIALLRLARTAAVPVPEDFAFGMDRYLTSPVPPNPDDVPRLMDQLAIIVALSRTVLGSGIQELVALSRDEFEKEGGAPVDRSADPESRSPRTRGRSARSAERAGPSRSGVSFPAGSAGVLQAEDLYAPLHFSFEFIAGEQVVFNLLNTLATHELFVVVTDVLFWKEGPDVEAPPQAAVKPVVVADAAAAAPILETLMADASPPEGEEAPPAVAAPSGVSEPIPLSRRERLVCGRAPKGPNLETPLHVKLGVDVYRFREE